MAWNKYYIFIKSPKLTNIQEILSKLKLEKYSPTQEVPLHHSNKSGALFTTFYNDCLLIVHPDLPFHFFADDQSETEKLFVEAFPDSEIGILIENSTVNLFGYTIIEKGNKIRMKNGSDGEIYHDMGELLPEEKEILSGKIFEDEEIRGMKADGMNEHEVDHLIKFEASWRVPNLLAKRYLGKPIDSMDANEIIVTMYK